jgi:uncharacterized protein (TIGR02145 family)
LSLNIPFKSFAQKISETVKDFDGYVYKTVRISNQTWMAENLKTARYNDGTPISLVADNPSWSNSVSACYCWYNNDIQNKDSYGALYNWQAVNTDKLCPTGWHVPTDAEWTTLSAALGGEDIAGGKLKEPGRAFHLADL